MQMGSCAPTGATSDADLLSLGHNLSKLDNRSGQMRVQRRITPSVFDKDDIAVALVAARIADRGDHARRSRAHVQRAQNPDVETGVPPIAVLAER